MNNINIFLLIKWKFDNLYTFIIEKRNLSIKLYYEKNALKSFIDFC